MVTPMENDPPSRLAHEVVVDVTTLRRHHKGLTVFQTEVTLIFRQQLNNIQEDAIILFWPILIL